MVILRLLMMFITMRLTCRGQTTFNVCHSTVNFRAMCQSDACRFPDRVFPPSTPRRFRAETAETDSGEMAHRFPESAESAESRKPTRNH